MTHPVSFRRHVLSIREKEGLTFAQTSRRFSVGIASLVRWNKQLEPKAVREGRPRKIDLDELAKDVEAHPSSYLYERAERFGVCASAIHEALGRAGISRKKKSSPSQGRRSQALYVYSAD